MSDGGGRSTPDTVMLDRLGLRRGEPARMRSTPTERWVLGRIAAVHSDGSVVLDGVARVLTCRVRAELVEVRRPGSRGRPRWSNLRDVAVTWEQLELF